MCYRCNSLYKILIQIDDEGYVCWNETALVEEGYSRDGGSLNCFYQEILRPPFNDFDIEYGPKVIFDGKRVKLRSDFVYFECSKWMGLSVSKGYLAKVQKRHGIRRYKAGILNTRLFP